MRCPNWITYVLRTDIANKTNPIGLSLKIKITEIIEIRISTPVNTRITSSKNRMPKRIPSPTIKMVLRKNK
ncbi:hypothetical protein NADRNF5_0649 [Nitrosopumilus adriaticus]|uniref:Uncharacterized protein n=1 Tax=Nitrosopumilus adriaticus TaxID=1580092 RepID=A0A0D5C1Z9_9ARCH|nr:hypothetical protein NADRNF5_0649 [Nitrosopumilus adriaticus]